ncbi:retsat, partial [Symbiodinium sp. CCMP2456]
HYVAGGCTHEFTDKGWTFDTGVHYVGRVEKYGKLLDLVSDEPIKFAQLGSESDGFVYDRIKLGEEPVQALRAGRQHFIEDLQKRFPEEREAIEKYVELVTKCNKGAELHFFGKLFARPIELLLDLLLGGKFKKLATRTAKEVLDELFSSELLKSILLGQFGDYGMRPSAASFFIHSGIVSHYLEGGYYPVGGPQRISRGLIRTIEKAGGRVLVNAPVARVEVARNRVTGVTLRNGTHISAPLVVSAAGAEATAKFFPQFAPPQKLQGGISHMYAFLGLRGTAEELELSSSNLWALPSPNIEGDMERYYADPWPMVDSGSLLLFVGFPSAKDPEAAARHPGKSTCVIITEAKEEWFSAWRDAKQGKRGADYEQLKKRFESLFSCAMLNFNTSLVVTYARCDDQRFRRGIDGRAPQHLATSGSLLSPMSVERFVHRGRDGRILDVDEFQVAKALLDGEVELLSQDVDSKHLFDLCLQFGHQNTAVAMMSYGVSGCVFKGPRSLPPHASAPAGAAEGFGGVGCNCPHWHTCRACSWGFPEEYGVWMEDWYASLLDAKNAAESAAAMPLFRTLLEACRSEAGCPGILTEEAMPYLLDVAILIGNTELARSCARHCNCFPLRRWRFQDFVGITRIDEQCIRTEIREKDVLVAALAAGLAIETLTVFHDGRDPSQSDMSDQETHDTFSSSQGSEVPMGPHSRCLTSASLAEAIVLSGDAQLWRRFQSLQLQLGPWPTHEAQNDMARFLLERAGSQVRLSPELLHRAMRAGLILSSFRLQVDFECQGCGGHLRQPCYASVLDLAIVFGQSDCARLCGAMDIKATELTLPASLEAMPLVWDNAACWCGRQPDVGWRPVDAWSSLPERRAAAAEALSAALQMSFRQVACSAGFGLFQALRSWARGKRVSADLVKLVLTFAAERPSLPRAFAGREGELPSLGHWWEESDHQGPQSPQPVAKGAASCVQAESVGVPDIHSAGAAAASSNEARKQPDSTTEKESGPDQDSTSDLLAAIRNSKSDNPPLSGDGVVIFRLGRWATSNLEEINTVLFDATGELRPLHHRVLEAGCEVAPEWSPARALFVPLTQPQLQELVHGNMYELGKLHVLALESDGKLIKDAFNRAIPRKVRPKLRRETLRVEEEQGAPDDEPLLVLEGGVQTDSSMGYPVYAGLP